jgi:DNA-binding NarL/FixJ family response regulator
MSEAKQSVVILYEHALLGEGIAKYLRANSGVEARVAPGHDLEAVTSALACGPTVVIFELSEPAREFDLSALAPQAVLIDVSTVVARGPAVSSDIAGLERILEAVSGPINVVPLAAQVEAIPVAAEVSLPAESCLGGILAAPAR